MMINVIVVDDEYLIRQRIKRCIDWNALGFHIAGEASNGKEALVLVDSVKPKIAVVDINMPYINGLEFAHIVKEKYPKMKVVILTGYGTFEYAQEALRAKVDEYLLKPINSEQLRRVVKEIRRQVEKENEAEARIHSLEIKSRQGNEALKEKFVQLLLDGRIKEIEKHTQDLSTYCTSLQPYRLRVIVIEIDGHLKSDWNQKEKQLWNFAVRNIFAEIFKNNHIDAEWSYDAKGRTVLILNGSYKNGEFLCIIDNARELVLKHLNFSVTAGISRVYDGYEKIGLCYNEAEEAVISKILFGCNSTVCYDSLKEGILNKNINITIRQSLLLNMRTRNTTMLFREIENFLDSAKEKKYGVDLIRLFMSEFIVGMEQYILESQIEGVESYSENYNIHELLAKFESTEEIKAWCHAFIANVFRKANFSPEGSNKNNIDIANRIKEYIDLHYKHKELSLESLVGELYLNPCYISSVFKKVTELSIKDYITAKRMEKAKELINSTQLSLLEISDEVGYNDPYYFSKRFKKHFGLSPTKFIENVRRA